ncbi:MAG: hypothetical protein WC580_01735 [Agrococcus sp.]
MAESILLGHAPRPADGAQLAKRIRSLVIAAEPAGIACTSIISAELGGADIARLDLDLTDFILAGEIDRDRARLQPQGAAVSSEPAVLRHLTVRASPMRVSGAEVTVDAQLRNLPFCWIETDNGELAVELARPGDERPLHGRAHVSVPKHQLGAAVLALAESALFQMGVSVSRFEVDVESTGPRSVRLIVDGKVRKGLLGATVHGSAHATIDDRMGVTLSDITLESANPLVAAMLAATHGRIRRYEGRPLDLASQLPAGIRLADVQVRVVDDVIIEARLV